jgi:hypothetical protein
MTSKTVINSSGKAIDFDAAVNIMDDEIRETLHNRQEWDSNQQFFSAYEKAHEKKHGEEWELSKPNPVW